MWNCRGKFSCYLSPTDLQYCKINYISCISRLSAFILPFLKHNHLSTANFGAFTFHVLILWTSKYVNLPMSCTSVYSLSQRKFEFQPPSWVEQCFPNYDVNIMLRFWCFLFLFFYPLSFWYCKLLILSNCDLSWRNQENWSIDTGQKSPTQCGGWARSFHLFLIHYEIALPWFVLYILALISSQITVFGMSSTWTSACLKYISYNSVYYVFLFQTQSFNFFQIYYLFIYFFCAESRH